MVILVTGGSGSGKSQYAENRTVKLNTSCSNLVYIATMMPRDEESFQKIERHQQLRKDKGFQTVECYKDIEKLKLEGKPIILLECMSNLLANEMYDGEVAKRNDKECFLREKIVSGIEHLIEQSSHVIVVTNEVFSDGEPYDEETNQYITILGNINQEIGNKAAQVIEVVCGLPIEIKPLCFTEEANIRNGNGGRI